MTIEDKQDLPDIAQVDRRKKIGLYLILIVVISLFFALHFYNRNNVLKEVKSEDNYAVTDDAISDEQVTPRIQPDKKTSDISQLDYQPSQEQIESFQSDQKELQDRLSAPLLISNSGAPSAIVAKPQLDDDPNLRFMQTSSSVSTETSYATLINSPNRIIVQGTLMHVIIESAIDSDLPGTIRAIVSEPVYSQDGKTLLIPIGSSLIGQYKSGLSQGQSRLFVVWLRLITPSGVTVNLGAQGSDSLGMAGFGADKIEPHFWQQFGTSALLSLIGAGTSNISSADELSSAYKEAVANSFQQTAVQTLPQQTTPPTFLKYQGRSATVFVEKDLDFGPVMQSYQPSNVRVF